MKKETKKAPTIRFRGFTDDWEQRKFSELFKRRMERNNGQFDKTKWISVANMYYQDPDKVTSNNIDTRTYVLRLGDISFEGHSNKEFKIGRFVENDIGDGVISELFPIYQHITSYDLNFWKHYINIENIMFPKLQRCIEVSYTSSNKLSEKFFLKESILVPAILEQKKIGTYLKKIDNLITLHQRKLDQLKTLKKYFLQNMFPAKGEKVPRIRFKGFTGDWEQRKVTELGYIYIGLVTTMTSHYSNHGTLLIRNSDIKDSCFEFDKKPIFLDEEFAKQNASRRHQVGDVITVHTGDIGTSAVITEKEEGSIGFATIVTRPYKEKITSEYLCTYLNTDTHKNFALNISTGDGRNNYNLKDYYECVVPVPRIKEQIKIADFINALNNLITLHQQKLNQLQTMKKFMLQNLFI